MNILLITDHRLRDLPGNYLLKKFVEENYDHKVILCHLGEEKFAFHMHKPRMVIFNNLYDLKVLEFAKEIKSLGVKILIMPTEGITFSDDQLSLFSHKNQDISFIDGYLSWNSRLSNEIRKNKNLDEKYIFETGCCRFDFYNQSLASTLKTYENLQKEYGLNRSKRNILVITNFINANYYHNVSQLDFQLRRQKADRFASFNAKKIAELEYKIREKYIKSLIKLAKSDELVDVNFILKIHPHENISFYKEKIMEAKSNNIVLMQNEYIWDLINISDIVISRSSTVSIESWILGKETIELQLEKTDGHFLSPIYKEGSHFINNDNKLKKIVVDILFNKLSISEKQRQYRATALKEIAYSNGNLNVKNCGIIINQILEKSTELKSTKISLTLKNYIKLGLIKLFGYCLTIYLVSLVKGNLSQFKFLKTKCYTKSDQKYFKSLFSHIKLE